MYFRTIKAIFLYFSVTNVEPLENYFLQLTFENGEVRLFDMKPYLETGIFSELKNEDLFRTVRVNFDSIEWNNEADFDPKLLYEKSKSVVIN